MKIAEFKALQFGTKIIKIPRKRWLRPDMTEKLLTGTLSLNTKKTTKKKNIQEPGLKILVKFHLGHEGSPPHPGCIMIPTTRCAQLLIQNHTEVINRLCLSKAAVLMPQAPRETVWWYLGIRPNSNSIFRIQPKLFLPGKNCCPFAALCDLKSDHLMHPYQIWAYIAPDSHATAIQQTSFLKNR